MVNPWVVKRIGELAPSVVHKLFSNQIIGEPVTEFTCNQNPLGGFTIQHSKKP